MATPTPVSNVFNVQTGLCNQNGRVALDSTAPAKTQEAALVDQLTGGTALGQAAAGQKLPECKAPLIVTQTPYKP